MNRNISKSITYSGTRDRILICGPWKITGGITTWIRQVLKSDLARQFDLIHFKVDKTWAPIGPPSEIPKSLETWWQSLIRLLKFRIAIQKYNPQYVFIPSVLGLGLVRDLIMCQMVRRRGAKAFLHLRSANWDWLAQRSRLWRLLLLTLAKGISFIVLMKNIPAEAQWLFVSTEPYLLPNFISDERIAHAQCAISAKESKSHEPVRILYTGAITKTKGALDFLEVIARLPDISADMVGPCTPSVREQIVCAIHKMNLVDRVRLWPPVTYKELTRFYARATLFLMLSHTEAFPNVLLEAMAHCLPIVATDVGAVSTILRGNREVAGIIVPPKDLDHAIRAVKQLLLSETLRARMGRVGMARVSQVFSERAFVERFKRILLNC